jgi:hypothetical protein
VYSARTLKLQTIGKHIITGLSQSVFGSSTTKIGRHDISESGIKHQKSNQIKSFNKI